MRNVSCENHVADLTKYIEEFTAWREIACNAENSKLYAVLTTVISAVHNCVEYGDKNF